MQSNQSATLIQHASLALCVVVGMQHSPHDCTCPACNDDQSWSPSFDMHICAASRCSKSVRLTSRESAILFISIEKSLGVVCSHDGATE